MLEKNAGNPSIDEHMQYFTMQTLFMFGTDVNWIYVHMHSSLGLFSLSLSMHL